MLKCSRWYGPGRIRAVAGYFLTGVSVANEKLLAIVTILSLIGSTGLAQEDVTIDDLRTIDALITGKEWNALYTFVNSKPQLTTGNDPLAVELRSFVDETKRGLLNRFDSGPSQPDGGGLGSTERSVASIY